MQAKARLQKVLYILKVQKSTYYRSLKANESSSKRVPKAHEVDSILEENFLELVRLNPWYGYKKMAVICRQQGLNLSDRQVYRLMKKHGLLLSKKRRNKGEKHQSQRLFELLPQRADELWQTDVTYIHFPGYGWWYAVTVIDYYSRYLLALHVTPSYRAQDCVEGLKTAVEESKRIRGVSLNIS